MLRDLEFWSETVLEFGTMGNCNEAYKTCAKCAVKYFLNSKTHKLKERDKTHEN